MTMMFFLGTLLLMSFSLPRQVFWSPQFAFESGFINEEPPLCRQETPFETFARTKKEGGKLARVNQNRSALCERRLFERKDRSSYYDFVFINSSERLSAISLKAIKLASEISKSQPYTWTVYIRDVVPAELRPYLRTVLEAHLVKALGSEKVVKHPDKNQPHIKIYLETREVSDPELLLLADMRVIEGKSIRTWSL